MSIKKIRINEQKKTAPILKALMDEKDLSYEEFAKIWGGSKSTAHALVNGECEPSYKVLSSLRRTGLSIDKLIDAAEGYKNYVSEPATTYQSEKKYSADLLRIIDEWPELCDSQKAAVLGVLDAFSKQDINSLKSSVNSA